MTAYVETYGRSRDTAKYGQNDLEAFFQHSGIVEKERLDHTPFLVFKVEGDVVSVGLARNSFELVRDHPPETKVMVQWPGQWQSDYFRMTVEDVRVAMVAKGLRLPDGTGEERVRVRAAPYGRCSRCDRTAKRESIGTPCESAVRVGHGTGPCPGEIIPGEVDQVAKPARCSVCRKWTYRSLIGQACTGSILKGNEGQCAGTIEETPDDVWQSYLDAGGA